MDAGACDLQDRSEVLGGVDQKGSEKSKDSVVWSVVETAIVIESEEDVRVNGKNEGLDTMGSELESDKAVVEGLEKPNDKEACGQRGSDEVPRQVEQGDEVPSQVEQGANKNSNNLVDGNVSETVVVINSGESSKVLAEDSKKKVPQAEKDSCVIDMKSGSGRGFGDRWDGERVCRICHLGSDISPERKMETANSSITADLINLGCGCKDELGVAHGHCAEAWFRLRGNRTCEICGETAQNITGHGDNGFMEDWHEATLADIGNNSSERNVSCWRRQPFCNFLMACLAVCVSCIVHRVEYCDVLLLIGLFPVSCKTNSCGFCVHALKTRGLTLQELPSWRLAECGYLLLSCSVTGDVFRLFLWDLA
ncbi:uncharacterized protein [Malus domestica]|uniref:uncharacterized protein n=1 Tax=Malus domestica TaxID=3750 RepID=UPI0010A9C8BC|nr:uncharacterized protein LOC103408878 [Malus domestica]